MADVREHAYIGDNSKLIGKVLVLNYAQIGKNVILAPDVTIGYRVIIYDNAVVPPKKTVFNDQIVIPRPTDETLRENASRYSVELK